MVWIVLIVITVAAILLIRAGSNGSGSESRYSKTRNWADFDPGTDTKKVGNPEYPNASMDSVMKNEFLEDILSKDK